MSERREMEERLHRLAARQHGAISRRQAVVAGLSRAMIRTQIRSGRWVRGPIAGVYRVAGHPSTWQHRVMAAVLSGPPGAAASHTSAAALFGLLDPPEVPHVSLPRGASGRRAGIVVHRSRLGPGPQCLVQNIPATVPARTLVDCAQLLDAPALMAVIDTALCRGLTTPAAVRHAAELVSPGGVREGLPILREALDVWTDRIQPGSPAEMRLLRRIERWGLPRPERQFELYDSAGRFVARIDLAWPERRRGLEYDGQEFHGARQWEADELRLTRIEALGWRVARVEKFDLLDGAERLRHVLASLLAKAA